MKNILIFLYLFTIVLANLIAYILGQKGLIITAFFLVPFDFIIRSYFHETWKGVKLLKNLISLITLGGLISFIINFNMIKIAVASTAAFIIANIIASFFYQYFIKYKYFIKVNGSDIIAIIVDSFIFQYIAFYNISIFIMSLQILIKMLGGFFWYWIIFKKYKLQDKW